MTRPGQVIAVVGTATEVGKTWVTARLCEELRRRGVAVIARKPVQSYDGAPEATDAAVLAAATGEDPEVVCPPTRSYPVPMAPPMATDVLGVRCPTLAEMVRELAWPEEPTAVGLVETVGGTRSPLAADGDSRALARAVAADLVLVVADAGLGVIDAARSAAEAVVPLPTLFFLNRFDQHDDLHRRNLDWLRTTDAFAVETGIGSLADALIARR